MKSAREQVVDIIGRFYTSTSDLKTIQNQYFTQNSNERNRVIVLSRDILRWKGKLDWFIQSNLNSRLDKLQPQLLAILELAAYELLLDDRVPNYAAINSAVDLTKLKFNRKTSGLVNAVLRKISISKNIKPNKIKDFAWYSFPEWLFNRWEKQFGKSMTRQLCDYYNSVIPLTIRRNTSKTDDATFIKMIESENIKLIGIDDSNHFYKVKSGGAQLRSSKQFKDGLFSFQDRAAGAIVEVLDPQPNEVILDVCCAPGTKTNYIAERMKNTGKLFASDSNKERINISKSDDSRLNNKNIIWKQKDATAANFPIADRVLVDVPCTGTGVIGRRPDIKWRRKPKHLQNVIELQTNILNNVSKYVKKGGILVYATCSLEDDENWKIVEAFLKLHDKFKAVPIENPLLKQYVDAKGALKTFPPKDKMDGMFAVKMVRK